MNRKQIIEQMADIQNSDHPEKVEKLSLLLIKTAKEGHTEIEKILKLFGAPGNIIQAGNNTCYQNGYEALQVLKGLFRPRLQNMLMPVIKLVIPSIVTLFLIHNRYVSIDAKPRANTDTDSSSSFLPQELWHHIIKFIPLTFAGGVLKYKGAEDVSSAVVSPALPAELQPTVSFALTHREVVQYKVAGHSHSLTREDFGVDVKALL